MFLASWYCVHSHINFVFGMVMRCRPLSSYMWVTSNCVWIVLELEEGTSQAATQKVGLNVALAINSHNKVEFVKSRF